MSSNVEEFHKYVITSPAATCSTKSLCKTPSRGKLNIYLFFMPWAWTGTDVRFPKSLLPSSTEFTAKETKPLQLCFVSGPEPEPRWCNYRGTRGNPPWADGAVRGAGGWPMTASHKEAWGHCTKEELWLGKAVRGSASFTTIRYQQGFSPNSRDFHIETGASSSSKANVSDSDNG